LNDSRLQTYAELIRDCDYENRNTNNMRDGLYIGRRGLGRIVTKFGKVIIYFETGGASINRELIKRTAIFFPNISYDFYVGETKYKDSFKKYHDIVNNDGQINTPKLPSLNECDAYYNKFIYSDPPVTENSMLKYILTCLLKLSLQ
jgi:hypothetical protein